MILDDDVAIPTFFILNRSIMPSGPDKIEKTAMRNPKSNFGITKNVFKTYQNALGTRSPVPERNSALWFFQSQNR